MTLRPRAHWSPWIAVLVATGPLSAQAVVVGSIRSELDGKPIAGAELTIANLLVRERSLADGRFQLNPLPPGEYRLAIRAIGFRSLTTTMVVTGTDTVRVDVSLSQAAVRLPTLNAEAPEAPSAVLRLLREHRDRHLGRFLDRALLAQHEAASFPSVLRAVAGVAVIPVRGAMHAATHRGVTSLDPRQLVPGLPPACYLAVFRDGIRIWAPGMAGGPPDLEKIRPHELQAVEIYRGPSETPLEYSGTGGVCGALVLWSRTGEP